MITGKNESQELIVGLLWCIFYRLSVIAVTIRVVYNYFNFLYETSMITGKSYMTLYEIKESCIMGNPGGSQIGVIKSGLNDGGGGGGVKNSGAH